MKNPNMRILTYDKFHGRLDFGVFDMTKNGGYATKKACLRCGSIWIAENHIDGNSICPYCNATGYDVLHHMLDRYKFKGGLSYGR